MQEDKVQRIFAQLVGAVTYVHLKGCVHRDLKLENILLDKHGSVKLVDFGFTREYSGNSSYLQTWCGTVCYSAPEMVKGEKYAGEKVDVWSLGIILYALLAGELPFDDDDESVTKSRILKEDIVCPDYFPQDARDLIALLLSKRPLLRPCMADILRHSWLSAHAPQQQEILKLQQPPPFSTQLEKDTLEKMRSAGVNSDVVTSHVLAQRCDSLAGWWAILIEKEERKDKRRQRRRREREKEEKTLRRLSAASGRLLTAPALREINEEVQTALLQRAMPRARGRSSKRSSLYMQPVIPATVQDDAQSEALPETPAQAVVEKAVPVVIEPEAQRSESEQLPQPVPVHAETLTPSTNSRDLEEDKSKHPMDLQKPLPSIQENALTRHKTTEEARTRRGRKRNIVYAPLREQLSMLRTWFKDSTRKSKSYTGPESVMATMAEEPPRPATPESQAAVTSQVEHADVSQSPQTRPEVQARSVTYPLRARLSTASSIGSSRSNNSNSQIHFDKDRLSLSPKPPPAHPSYRHRSGLTGRKSTSSSVSSVRSIRIHLSGGHSKTSSTSSASISIASPKLSHSTTIGGRARSRDSSKHRSQSSLGPPSALGILGSPAAITKTNRRPTPGSLGSLPTFADLNKGPVASPFTGLGPPSPGMHPVFAHRRKKAFRGPAPHGNSPRSRGTHLTPDDASEFAKAKTARKSEILEEDEDEEETITTSPIKADATGPSIDSVASNREQAPYDQSTSALLEEEEEDMDVEEVESFGAASAEDANVSRAVHSGYFGGEHVVQEAQ